MVWCATLLMLTLVALSESIGEDFDWCKHDCVPMFPGRPTQKHTMCRYKKGGGPECGQYKSGFTKEEQDAILDLHNKFRATVANGNEKRGAPGPQPSAANMMELVWDDEVAMIAQRWADQCMIRGHDDCTKTMDGIDLGQNVGAMSGYGMNPSRMEMITDRITAWYDEVKDMVATDVDSVFSSSTKTIGHYTQLIWAGSTRVGCGLAHLNAGSFAIKIVCNYKRAGNYVQRPVYIKGPAASQCPKNCERSTRYPGLCKATGNDLEIGETGTMLSSPFPSSAFPTSAFPTGALTPGTDIFSQLFPQGAQHLGDTGTTFEIPISSLPPKGSAPQTVVIPIQVPTAPTPVTVQQPVEKKKKESLLWRIITMPWRILKWLFSLPLRLLEAIENLFSKSP